MPKHIYKIMIKPMVFLMVSEMNLLKVKITASIEGSNKEVYLSKDTASITTTYESIIMQMLLKTDRLVKST